jgi:hypothetical protein
MDFVIDERLKALIPARSKEELKNLEESILEWGCLNPLKVWPVSDSDEIILLDGHNRLAICSEHNVSYDTECVLLIDREAAIEWVNSNRLGQRNLSAGQMLYLRGFQQQQGKSHHAVVERGVKYAQAVDVITNATNRQIRQQILKGEFKLTELSTLKMAELAKREPEIVLDMLEKIRKSSR